MLIETIPAAFEMDEILYELRDHSAGLNAGRWDYMFSAIKCFRDRPDFVLPDRNSVTMTVPFMRAYTELLVKTCHRRGAHAMGGMAAFIPSRKDPEANEAAVAKLRDDKGREAGDGFDGSWVAHPDSVGPATEEFDEVLGDRPNQLDRQRDDVEVTAAELLDIAATDADCTREGLRSDVNVGIQYISSWLRGNGAAGIHGLMEDAATAEIARSQVWQWIRHGVELDDGSVVTPELLRETEDEQLELIRERDRRRRVVLRAGPPRRLAGAVRAGRARQRVRRLPHPAGVRLPARADRGGRRLGPQPSPAIRRPASVSSSRLVASRTAASPRRAASVGSRADWPTTAWHATPARRQRSATSPTALPASVCSSRRPSPVITREARLASRSNPIASST